MRHFPVLAVAALCLFAVPAAAVRGPETCVPESAATGMLAPAEVKEGLRTILLTPAGAKDIVRQFPVTKQYVDAVRGMELFAAPPGERPPVGANTFSFALVEDKDLRVKLLFLYIEGPSSCGDRAGCSLRVFADNGMGGFQKAIEVYTPSWMGLRKTGKDLALILSGHEDGTAKWSYLPNPKRFSYAGRDDIDDTPLRETLPPKPQRIPAADAPKAP